MFCPYKVQSFRRGFSCVGSNQDATGDSFPISCPCDPVDQLAIAQRQDDSVDPEGYGCDAVGCDATSSPDPEICDGERADDEAQPDAPVDPQCGDDEHDSNACDKDGAPVRYSSGTAESNPMILFSVPAPDGIFFGFSIKWSSHLAQSAAQTRFVNGNQDTVPTLHHHEEATHFLGRGWQDNFSDRLFITTRNNAATRITWQSMRGTVTFKRNGGTWQSWSRSWSGKYEIIERTDTSDGFGKWVVRTTDPTAPRRAWTFEEVTYTSYGNQPYKLGRLRRHAWLDANDLTNLNGRYGYTVNWGSGGVITDVVDTLNRSLEMVYFTTVDGPKTMTRTLSAVRYRPAPAPTGTAVDVVTLRMDPSNTLLDMVERAGTAGYTRSCTGSKVASTVTGAARESRMS